MRLKDFMGSELALSISIFIKRILMLGIWCLLIGACSRGESEPSASEFLEDVYTKTVAGKDGKEITLLVKRNRDEMMCGGKKVVHEAECYLDKYSSPQCLEQEITISSNGSSVELQLEGHIVKPSKKRLTKYPFWYPFTGGWVCQKSANQNSYIVLSHYTGGNCIGCEWVTVYDLKGKLLYRSEKNEGGNPGLNRLPDDFKWPNYHKDFIRLSRKAPEKSK